MKTKLKVGQKVLVIAGSDSGKKGEIIGLFPKKRKVVVKGVNIKVRHIKKTQEREGKRVEFEAPLDISNVMLIDSNGAVTRVGVVVSDKGEKFYFEKTTKKKIRKVSGK